MPQRFELPTDINTQVDGLPPAIKAKITQLVRASIELGFIGSQPPEYHEAIEEEYLTRRYNLERTIMTHLDRAK